MKKESLLQEVFRKNSSYPRVGVTPIECPTFLAFVGLLAVRTPPYRKKIGGFCQDQAKRTMDIAYGNEERFGLCRKTTAAPEDSVIELSKLKGSLEP